MTPPITAETWPSLPLEAWSDTCATLHLWTQIVGKIRLAHTPRTNHSWHVTLYVTPTGLTTGSIPYSARAFQIDFDFVAHEIKIHCDDGRAAGFPLQPQSVAAFYRRVKEAMKRLDLEVKIYPKPNEITNAVPFDQDEAHATYDAEYANRFWRVLLQSDRIFKKFRARFVGKCSPVHLFWGAFDLAVTRFSGRGAPLHPGGAPNMPVRVMQEAYSHEVSSCGFWPGSEQFPHPVFYSYCYPTPPEFSQQTAKPNEAFYSNEMGEFMLLYEAVQRSDDPEDTLMQFLQSTYAAAANTGHWDRKALECDFSRFER